MPRAGLAGLHRKRGSARFDRTALLASLAPKCGRPCPTVIAERRLRRQAGASGLVSPSGSPENEPGLRSARVRRARTRGAQQPARRLPGGGRRFPIPVRERHGRASGPPVSGGARRKDDDGVLPRHREHAHVRHAPPVHGRAGARPVRQRVHVPGRLDGMVRAAVRSGSVGGLHPLARCHGVQACGRAAHAGRGAAPPGAEDGGGRAAGRRRRPRLQQRAVGDPQLRRAPARWTSRADDPTARRPRGDRAGGSAGQRADAPAPRVQPPAGARAARRSISNEVVAGIEAMLRRLLGADVDADADPGSRAWGASGRSRADRAGAHEPRRQRARRDARRRQAHDRDRRTSMLDEEYARDHLERRARAAT